MAPEMKKVKKCVDCSAPSESVWEPAGRLDKELLSFN
jgi:hypothetical protein